MQFGDAQPRVSRYDAGPRERLTAARLAAEGASLVLVDRVKDALAETLAIIERTGVPVITVEADVTRWSDSQRYVAAAVERFGGVDAFFNNAGVLGAVSPLIDYPEAEFDRVMAVNVKGVWLGMKAVAPAMAARGAKSWRRTATSMVASRPAGMTSSGPT